MATVAVDPACQHAGLRGGIVPHLGVGVTEPRPQGLDFFREGRVRGDGAGQGGGVAQLRWFLVEPSERGTGLGRRLVGEALGFCRAAGYRSVFLWTVGGLDAAAHLYVAHGFRKTETRPTARLWGADLSEERYDLTL